MIQRRNLLLGTASLALSSLACQPAQAAGFRPNLAGLEHRVTNASAPEVFFIPELSDAAMLRVYRALSWKPSGRVGIKVNFEGHGKPYIDPRLITSVVREAKGTFLESNTYSSTRERLALAAELGFAGIAPTDIIDDEGSIDLPVPGGFHLKSHRVGSHFANYDSVISIVRFKLHNLPMLGGTLKNLSITLSPYPGRCNIHSGGRAFNRWIQEPDKILAESITDAVKAALAARPGRWAFLAAMPAFAPRDNCPGAVDAGDIGVFASMDPVAIDSVCTDIALQSAPDAATRGKWIAEHTLSILDMAEKNGVGSRAYRLTVL
jgi:hypothetical protein